MAVNKNFVVKNGLEVNTNLLVADLDTQTVGIGTTIAPHELHVVGGIGVTNLNVTGVATIANLRIGGISTFVGFTTFLGDVNVGGASTFTGLVDINGGGQANTFKVEDLTDNRVVIAGSGGELEDDGNFTFTGNQLTLGVGATVGGGLTASTVMVEDLTNNRVVIAGTDGELEDSSNFVFDGSQLILGVGATVGGALTVTGDVSIGAGTPDVKLHVQETINTSYNSAAASLNTNNLFKIENDSTTSRAFAGMAFRAHTADVFIGVEERDTNVGDLYFVEEGTELVRILGTGHVGIGTSNPTGNNAVDAANESVLAVGIATARKVFSDSLEIGAKQVISSARQLQNIASLDSTTTATIESAIANAPNTFTDLQITGIATFKNDVEFHGVAGITSISFDQSSNALNFVDNAKATFGISSDLQIYHDGSNSYIRDAGTGSLHVQGRNLVLEDIDGENYLAAYLNGQVALYFDNGVKLETANDGVTITGGVNASGISTFTAATFTSTVKVEDLAPNRVVFVGAGDSLTDDANFTFDRSQLILGVGATVGGALTVTGGLDVTGDRVGINSVNGTGPSAPLEIRAASTFQTNTGHIVLSGDSATNGEGPQIVFSESGSGSSHAGAYIGHVRQGSNSIGDLVFGTRNVTGDVSTVPSERLRITSAGDVEFKGAQGVTTAFFDRSANALNFVDDAKATFGTGVDLQIYHSGNSNIIDTPTSRSLQIKGNGITLRTQGNENYLQCTANGSVDLYHDNSKKFETTPDGVIVTGIATVRASSDPTIKIENTDSSISADQAIGSIEFKANDGSNAGDQVTGSIESVAQAAFTGQGSPSHLIFSTNGASGADALAERLRITHEGDVEFKGANGITSMSFDRSSNSLDFVDRAKAQFGTGNDLQIYHDGNNSYISDTGTGELRVSGDQIKLNNAGNTASLLVATAGGSVDIYHNGTKKFETGSDGVIATGIVTATGGFALGIHSAGTSVVSGPVKTLNFVGSGNTFAYNASTDTIDISIAGGSGGGGGGSGVTETDTTVSTTNPTGVGSFATASFRSASVIAQINQLNTDFQVGRYLMIHDGTTVTVVEESAVSTGSTMLGSFTGVIDGSNVELRVTLASAGVSTVTTKIDTVTV